jgi:peptide/nickel transport system substrate-binding protein
MSQFDAEPDEQRRTQLALQIAKLQHDNVPAIVAYFITGLRGVRTNVQRIAAGPVDHIDASQVWLST